MKQVEFVVETRQDCPSLERLAGMLNRTQVGTEKPVDSVQWELSREDGFIRCQFPIGSHPLDKKKYCDRVGRILAEYTLMDQEPVLLRHLFIIRFGLPHSMETDKLITEATALLDGESQWGKLDKGKGRERRLRKLATHFSAYLEHHDRLHLDGFLRFRLHDYRTEVQEAAEAALEDRLMEKQYQEFMTLLKSMVEWQETRMSTLHLLHSGGHDFRFLDEEMRPLEQVDGEWDSLMDRESFSSKAGQESEQEEGRVVSQLLAAAPNQLFIHTNEPEAQVIRTIIGIFGERAALYPKVPLH